MHISGSLLITAAFVSAMLILQESSATAQTCEQTQHDTCYSFASPCSASAYYVANPWLACDHCKYTADAAYKKCVNARTSAKIRAGVNKPGGSTLGTNTPPKSKQPPIKPVSVGGANTDNNNQSGGRSDTQRTGGGSKH